MKIINFINIYQNQKIIVCGCGESALQLQNIQNQIIIGVNDIGRLLTPNYLLVVNPSSSFNENKKQSIINTKASYFFTQYQNDWNELNDKKILIKLGTNTLSNLDNPEKIDFSKDSPFMAVILAYKMGASKIGLIGVDFTPNHFHDKDGTHLLVKRNLFPIIDQNYNNLFNALQQRNIQLYNLSSCSLLTKIPKISLDQFCNPCF